MNRTPIPIDFLHLESPRDCIEAVRKTEFVICGCVRVIRRLLSKVMLVLDDGFASIPVLIQNTIEDVHEPCLGDSLRVIGVRETFKNEVQVKAKSYTVVPFAEELAFWIDVQTYWSAELARPAIKPQPFRILASLENNLSEECPCCCHAPDTHGFPTCSPPSAGAQQLWPRLFSRFVQIAKVAISRFPGVSDEQLERALGQKQRKGALSLRCMTRCAVAFARAEIHNS